MRRRIGLALTFGLLLVVLSASSVFAAPALKAGTHTVTTKTSGQEILPVSAAQCAAWKAANPKLANNPKLCQVVHGWTETDTHVVSNGVQPYTTGACYTGTRSFHDYVSNIWWEFDLDTKFSWNNYLTCNSAPVLVSENCWVNYEFDTSISQHSCYHYNYWGTNWISTAAVDTVWITEYWPGGNTRGYYKSQRRECYSYDADACNWTNWNGI